jgi:hypothetical protein
VDNLLLGAVGSRQVARQLPPAVSRPNPSLTLDSIQIIGVSTDTTCVSTSTGTTIILRVSTDTNIKPGASTSTHIICRFPLTIFRDVSITTKLKQLKTVLTLAMGNFSDLTSVSHMAYLVTLIAP